MGGFRTSVIMIMALVALLVAGFHSVPTASASALDVRNVGEVSPGIFRGSRLSDDADYRFVAEKLGANVVVNLERFLDDSQKKCAAYKLECLEFPILLPPLPHGDRFFNYETLKKAFYTVLKARDEQGLRVYFHCYHGSDRTGTLAAAIQIRERACGDTYDKPGLRKLVADTFKQHKFHQRLYPRLYETVISWTENPPEWICAKP